MLNNAQLKMEKSATHSSALILSRDEQCLSIARSVQVDTTTQRPIIPMFLPEVFGAKRIAPNLLLRSHIFGISRRELKPRQKELMKIVTGKNHQKLNVFFTGPALNQEDFSLWLELINVSNDNQLGAVLRISQSEILRRLDKNNQFPWLKKSLGRLKTSKIEFFQDGASLAEFKFIEDVVYEQKTRMVCFSISTDGYDYLFSDREWTGLNVGHRMALKGKPLAQWLHAFYSSHAKPFQYKVETLHLLCKSEASLADFQRSLGQAISCVNNELGWQMRIDKKSKKLIVPNDGRQLTNSQIRNNLKMRNKAH